VRLGAPFGQNRDALMVYAAYPNVDPPDERGTEVRITTRVSNIF
jgi:hypothetical protein